MDTCRGCDALLPAGRHGLKVYCSPECRYRARDRDPMRRSLTCADCGVGIFKGRGSLPQGEARCRPCRRLTSIDYSDPSVHSRYRTPCVDCDAPSWGLRCRPCADKAQIIRSDDDPRRTRRSREQAAPGLNYTARRALLKQWKLGLLTCSYCPEPATSIDHIIPLVRGGSNHEGNLTPACGRCNSRKNSRTIMEWRLGRQAARMKSALEWPEQEPKPPKKDWYIKPWAVHFPECRVCGSVFTCRTTRALYCGQWCRSISMRNSYRVRVGIPIDAPLYSRAG